MFVFTDIFKWSLIFLNCMYLSGLGDGSQRTTLWEFVLFLVTQVIRIGTCEITGVLSFRIEQEITKMSVKHE